MKYEIFIKKIKETALPVRLVKGVIQQTGGWDSFKEKAEDVTNHGAATGWAGFIYYNDTIAFAKKFRSEILEMLKDFAADCGEDPMKVLSGFKYLKGLDTLQIAEAIFKNNAEYATTVLNSLAWYALEEVCHRYVELKKDKSESEEEESDE